MHRFGAYTFICVCFIMKWSGFPLLSQPQIPEKFRAEHEELYKNHWLSPTKKLDVLGDHFMKE